MAMMTEQIDSDLGEADVEIARLREQFDAQVAHLRAETEAELTKLRDRKKLLQALRRTYPAKQAAGPTRRRRTAGAEAVVVVGVRRRRRTARAAVAGVAVNERKQQILKVTAQKPVGAAELAKELDLTETRVRQIASGMVKEGTLLVNLVAGPNSRSRNVFAPSAAKQDEANTGSSKKRARAKSSTANAKKSGTARRKRTNAVAPD